MAGLVGYKSFGAANIHYGKLGRRVADSLGVGLKYPILALITMDWPKVECEWTLRPQLSAALEQLGLVHAPKPQLAPDEQRWLREGKLVRTVTNAYERNARARQLCLDHYGAICYICGFSFGEIYGKAFEGIIHVHHLTELSEIGREYLVAPVKDLRPVCPNCHAVTHRREPAYSIQEVREFISHHLKP